jgi:hypothetical protein
MGRFNPPGIEPHGGRGKAAGLILLACALLFAAPVGVSAQPADNIRTYHVPARSFNIPFTPTENDPRIEVLLHVSQDRQTYKYVGSARPNERRFFFTAPADGCYYFIVQTKDPSGALSPADLHLTPPSIRVCVDTQGPIIEELAAVPSESGLPVIRWKINEANLKDIRADYRSVNGDQWLPLLLPIVPNGNYPWKPPLGGELEVRMWAQDKAGQWSQMKTMHLRVADNVSGMRPPPEPAGPSKVMHVKSKTFQLQYELDDKTKGPSGVASVDIWKLFQGRGWQKCKESGTPTGTATVTVEASGRWGLRLIPRSGAGLAERDPQPGDAPDIWVEVDDKPPQVKVTKVTVAQEGEDGYLTVYWTADDTFLRAMPITIWMKDPTGAEWTPIAKDLSNTGNWRHRTDDLNLGNRYEFSLKVTAIDEAGNVGSDTWRDPVKVDLKIPRIKSIDVKPGAAAGGDGQEAYRSPSPPFGSLSDQQRPLTSPTGAPRSPSTPASPTNGTNGGFSNVRPPSPP